MSPRATKKSAERAGAQDAPRPRGRPRSETANRAILVATLELLAEGGLQRMSMDAVAERAGVSKATIYRRWASKNELAADAILHLRPTDPVPDTGTLIGDLAALGGQARRFGRANVAGLVPRLLAEALGDEELHALFMETGVGPVRALIAELVERAVKRGELPQDTDVELLVDVLHGSAVYRMLIHRGDPAAFASHLPRLVELLTQKR